MSVCTALLFSSSTSGTSGTLTKILSCIIPYPGRTPGATPHTPDSDTHAPASTHNTPPSVVAMASTWNICSNCLGEERTDGPKFKICTQCRTSRYCSLDCQRNHWKAHKPSCKLTGQAVRGDISAKRELEVKSKECSDEKMQRLHEAGQNFILQCCTQYSRPYIRDLCDIDSGCTTNALLEIGHKFKLSTPDRIICSQAQCTRSLDLLYSNSAPPTIFVACGCDTQSFHIITPLLCSGRCTRLVANEISNVPNTTILNFSFYK